MLSDNILIDILIDIFRTQITELLNFLKLNFEIELLNFAVLNYINYVWRPNGNDG